MSIENAKEVEVLIDIHSILYAKMVARKNQIVFLKWDSDKLKTIKTLPNNASKKNMIVVNSEGIIKEVLKTWYPNEKRTTLLIEKEIDKLD